MNLEADQVPRRTSGRSTRLHRPSPKGATDARVCWFSRTSRVGLVALLLFGPKRLPEMARGLGKGLREFKESVTSGDKTPTAELTAASDTSALPARGHETNGVS
ncbi:MAG: twin-arginine translocase TatA/TatE family subunit [Actinobacteria bacterium]|nr:twin-arginine translocase TatA/TatE family subunit [Actinomycetota bacterium]